MRSRPSRQGYTDPRYHRQHIPVVLVACFGCQKSLRRKVDRSSPVIVLCPDCKRTVERTYDAKLREQGIVPSVMPGNQWMPAWQRLSDALYSGDRELIAGLLPTAAAA